jgi:hypothetical protein
LGISNKTLFWPTLEDQYKVGPLDVNLTSNVIKAIGKASTQAVINSRSRSKILVISTPQKWLALMLDELLLVESIPKAHSISKYLPEDFQKDALLL